MKNIFIPMLLLALCLTVNAQNCKAPVSSMMFQQKVNQLTSIRQDQQRLAIANEFVKSNCLLANQVKQIAGLFGDDITRLNFVQNAYPTTFDKDNFYDVYDAFAYFSTVMRLHDFIEDLNQKGNHQVWNNPSPAPEYNFPKYNYPSYKTYKEQTRCSEPVSDDVFYKLLQNIMNQQDDEVRTAMAVQLAKSNCLTVEQIMKMGSLIGKEQKRLDYLKQVHDYSYDIDNFQYSDQLLTTTEDQEDFKNYMHSLSQPPSRMNNDNGHHNVPVCKVSDEEMKDIVSSIKNQTFSNTQLTVAKQIVSSKQCFTTMQIRQIIDIFTFESAKLDMAKYCYAYCIDKSNYYKINDCFTFSSSVTDLNQYISSQH